VYKVLIIAVEMNRGYVPEMEFTPGFFCSKIFEKAGFADCPVKRGQSGG